MTALVSCTFFLKDFIWNFFKCLSVYYFLKTPHNKRSHSCNSLPPFLPPSPHLTCISIYISLARSPARRSPPPRALSGGRQQLLHVELCVFVSLSLARARAFSLSVAASRGYADVCWRMRHMLTYAGVCWRMLGYADICWRMLTYAGVCWRMLTYADVCMLLRARVRAKERTSESESAYD